MKILIALVAALFLVIDSAQADLLCARNNIKPNKKGRVALARALQTTADTTCPRGFSPVFDTAAVAVLGQQGQQGPQGEPGTINISQCRFLTENTILFGGDDFEMVSAGCSPSEYLLTHAGSASDINVDMISTVLTSYPGESIAAGIQYYFGRNDPGSFDSVGISASAICCPR